MLRFRNFSLVAILIVVPALGGMDAMAGKVKPTKKENMKPGVSGTLRSRPQLAGPVRRISRAKTIDMGTFASAAMPRRERAATAPAMSTASRTSAWRSSTVLPIQPTTAAKNTQRLDRTLGRPENRPTVAVGSNPAATASQRPVVIERSASNRDALVARQADLRRPRSGSGSWPLVQSGSGSGSPSRGGTGASLGSTIFTIGRGSGSLERGTATTGGSTFSALVASGPNSGASQSGTLVHASASQKGSGQIYSNVGLLLRSAPAAKNEYVSVPSNVLRPAGPNAVGSPAIAGQAGGTRSSGGTGSSSGGTRSASVYDRVMDKGPSGVRLDGLANRIDRARGRSANLQNQIQGALNRNKEALANYRNARALSRDRSLVRPERKAWAREAKAFKREKRREFKTVNTLTKERTKVESGLSKLLDRFQKTSRKVDALRASQEAARRDG